MIIFVVEDNHIGFVIALRKFKNSILNFVVGYFAKRPAGIQNSAVEYSTAEYPASAERSALCLLKLSATKCSADEHSTFLGFCCDIFCH
nr:hypothetical protein CFP56_76400 [Quercus suber]